MKKYWLLPLILLLTQFIYTSHSMGQIRYEELAESVRNVFWLENHLVYDGISSNVGWYGTLLLVYKLFGFFLNEAKIFRLTLHFISILSLSLFLRKYLHGKALAFSILAIALSPTLLFFNTLQTSYGLDLQYLPIILYLLSFTDSRRLILQYLFPGLAMIIAMVAWMSYPTFAYYLPALIMYYFYLVQNEPRGKVHNIILPVTAVIFFVIPLLVSFLYINNSSLLIYDYIEKSGLFRGAGLFYLNWQIFSQNITALFNDLLFKPNSYYYEISLADFSLGLPLISLLTIFVLFIKKAGQKKYRLVTIAIIVTILLNIIALSFTFDQTGQTGLRRSTPLLAAIYAVYVMAWKYFQDSKEYLKNLRTLMIIILLIIPIHHLFVFPINYYNLSTLSPRAYTLYFARADTPTKSLDMYLSEIQKNDLRLDCFKDNQGNPVCRYQELYSALLGACTWNHLSCYRVLGYDYISGKYILLEPSLWTSYYFKH